MGTNTATVETLTAEVRVLMVGSRQVTLSVAKQLDLRPISDVEPFGRVALGDGGHVIGRDPSGTLVLARFADWWRIEVPPLDLDTLIEPISVCRRRHRRSGGGWIQLQYRNVELRFEVAATLRQCDGDLVDRECECDSDWLINGNKELLDDIVAGHRAKVALHRRMADLPLIVLAGLR